MSSYLYIYIYVYTRWVQKQTGIAWLLENYNSYNDKCFPKYFGLSIFDIFTLDEKIEKKILKKYEMHSMVFFCNILWLPYQAITLAPMNTWNVVLKKIFYRLFIIIIKPNYVYWFRLRWRRIFYLYHLYGLHHYFCVYEPIILISEIVLWGRTPMLRH